MELNYIQLPPMPSDMPTELIEIVWEFARMEEMERKKFIHFMWEEMGHGADNREKEKLLKMIEESGGEANPYVEEFNSLMWELIGTLVAQACEMVTRVLQYYCIDEKFIKKYPKRSMCRRIR